MNDAGDGTLAAPPSQQGIDQPIGLSGQASDASSGPGRPGLSPSNRSVLEFLGFGDGPGPSKASRDEKVFIAEQHVSLVRALLVTLTAFVYLVLMEHQGTVVWLASVLIGLSIPYAIYVWKAKPYELHEVFRNGETLAITDAVIIGGWVLATGGFESPFFVLFYVAVAAVAYRFDLRQVLMHSLGYMGLYLAVLGANGDLTGHGAALTMRIATIPLVGVLSGLLSSAYFDQVRQRFETRDRLQQERMEAMSRAHRTLRDQEEKWRSILTNTPDMIVVTARNGTIEFLNRPAPGFDADEMVGTNIREHVPKPSRETLEESLHTVFHDEEQASFEMLVQGPSGAPIWYTVRLGPIRWGGKITGAALSATDITTRKEAEEETARFARKIQEHARELERSNQELSRYAELAAHDLQEPLRDVTRYVQLLDRRYGDVLDEDGQEAVGFAVEGARRMHELLNELLHYSQLRASTLEMRPVELDQLLEGVVTALQRPLAEEGAQVSWPQELPTVLADPSHLATVLHHLILNGVGYNESETPTLKVETERRGSMWAIRVHDNGMGIDPEHKERIFEPFKRLHTRERYPGTGIGLALCKRIVEGHGGTLTVDSEPGEGSTFTLTVPPAHQVAGPTEATSAGEAEGAAGAA